MIERLQADNTAAEQHVTEVRHRAGIVAHEDADRLSSRAVACSRVAGTDDVKDSGLPRMFRARDLAGALLAAHSSSRAARPDNPRGRNQRRSYLRCDPRSVAGGRLRASDEIRGTGIAGRRQVRRSLLPRSDHPAAREDHSAHPGGRCRRREFKDDANRPLLHPDESSRSRRWGSGLSECRIFVVAAVFLSARWCLSSSIGMGRIPD
jgi:hypothetical protein